MHLKSAIVYAVKCGDCGETCVGKTERKCARRMFEHGAPKQNFGKQPNTKDDVDNKISTTNDKQPRTHKSRRTTDELAGDDQPNPPLRRSSRIRNKTK